MKRFSTLILSIALAGQAWASDFVARCSSGQYLEYNITSNNEPYTAEVTDNYWVDDYSGLVNIPEKVTYKGREYSVTSIGDNAFKYSSDLTSVTIPESVTSIGSGAFSGCSSLTSITIPNSVTSIGYSAFSGCSGLTTISIPNTVVSIANTAFENCNNLDYNAYNNAYYLGNEENPYVFLLSAKKTTITECTIPNGCKFINESAFRGCNELTTVTIPNSVVSIGNEAFDGCILESINLPNSLTEINYGLFRNCSGLTSITIPNSVTRIDVDAFYNCPNLDTIIWGNYITDIGSSAFVGCNLSSIIIPESVTNIGGSAFDCDGLTSVICLSAAPPALESDAFPKSDVIYVPATSVDAYKSATFWKRKEIMPFGIVSAKSSNEASGTVQGDSILLQDSVITITATPKDGYHFIGWNDGNKDNPRIFNEAKDTAVIAWFEAHTIVTDTAVAPTCIATGLTEGSHCAVCNKKIVGQQIVPIINHSAAIDEAVAPTCTESGLTKGIHCPVCGEILVPQEYIPAKGHTEVVDEAVAATCTESGLTEGKHCSVCGIIIVAQEGIEAGHTVVIDSAVAPTCTKHGLTEGSHCSVCGEVFVEQTYLMEIEHTLVKDTIAATCTNSGIICSAHCSVCGEVFAIPNETEIIPPTGHTTVIDNAVAATCTESGLTEGSHCSVCNEVIVAQTKVPALGHKFINYVYNNDATTDADGTETATCERGCGATDTRVAEGTKLPKDNTAVNESAANAVNIYAHGRTIIVENATDEIRVYDAMGRIVGRDVARNVSTINVDKSGVYIVKIGGTIKRVVAD